MAKVGFIRLIKPRLESNHFDPAIIIAKRSILLPKSHLTTLKFLALYCIQDFHSNIASNLYFNKVTDVEFVWSECVDGGVGCWETVGSI